MLAELHTALNFDHDGANLLSLVLCGQTTLCALARYFILKKLHTPDRNLHIPLMPTPLLYASLAEIFPDRKRKDFDPGHQDRSHLFLRVS